jgi:PhnB protein
MHAQHWRFMQKSLMRPIISTLVMPDGRIDRAQIRIGNSVVMLADEFPDHGAAGPVTLGGSCIGLHLLVTDCAAADAQACGAGATGVQPPELRFYGAISARVTDPFGYKWTLSEPREVAPHDEMVRRMAAL